jgi:hypothetical protein
MCVDRYNHVLNSIRRPLSVVFFGRGESHDIVRLPIYPPGHFDVKAWLGEYMYE